MSVNLGLIPKPTDFDPRKALEWIRPEADWLALRHVQEYTHKRCVRNARPDANSVQMEHGVMIEAMVDGQLAYAGTSDLTQAGLVEAARRAASDARATAPYRLTEFTPSLRPPARSIHRSPSLAWLDSTSLAEFTDRLIAATRRLKVSDKIVTAVAEAVFIESDTHYVSTHGIDIAQRFRMTWQHFGAIAQDGGETQSRSMNGPTARCLQGGLENYEWEILLDDCQRVGQEAIDLLAAENCPNEVMDLLLAPDQMMLQIHESIGHPLELDRILGDERNYAGWSFISPGDFGNLQYGSHLLNVTFAPDFPGEFASCSHDDGAATASREDLIREGRLLRGLGGVESQARLGLPGVANFRSASWNRAPIDRMGNINLEPGASSLQDLIGAVRRGVWMEANRSWSIDDYRRKFQFGCEYARLIEDGRLTRVLKNPNYRGVTIPFWHALDGVGNSEALRAFGTPYCGKGEPNQVIRVGHASPPCRFRSIQVFGGGP